MQCFKRHLCLFTFFLLVGNKLCLGELKEISTGEPITVKERDFTITPSPGWEILRGYPNMSLLLQIPARAGLDYQRTIQVMAFKGSYYLDDLGAEQFVKELNEKIPETSGRIHNFSVRPWQKATLKNGQPAILFYADFMMEDKAFMQAHLLTSTKTNHYLITFTDLAKYFQGEGESDHLTPAWATMISLELKEAPPIRYFEIKVLSVLFVAFSIVIFFVIRRRRRRAQTSYSKSAATSSLESDYYPVSGETTAISQLDSELSHKPYTLPPDSQAPSSAPPSSSSSEKWKT